MQSQVAAAALAKLMSSTNASLREAAHRAFSEAALEVALRTASSKPGSPSQAQAPCFFEFGTGREVIKSFEPRFRFGVEELCFLF